MYVHTLIKVLILIVHILLNLVVVVDVVVVVLTTLSAPPLHSDTCATTGPITAALFVKFARLSVTGMSTWAACLVLWSHPSLSDAT